MKSIALKINHRQHEDRALWITLLLRALLAGLRPAHASEAQLDVALANLLRLPREADFLALMFNDPAAMTEALMPDPSSWVRFP